MYDDEMELNLEDLDNVMGGVSHEIGKEVALGNLTDEHERRKTIDELKKAKEELEYYRDNNNSKKTGSRR